MSFGHKLEFGGCFNSECIKINNTSKKKYVGFDLGSE